MLPAHHAGARMPAGDDLLMWLASATAVLLSCFRFLIGVRFRARGRQTRLGANICPSRPRRFLHANRRLLQAHLHCSPRRCLVTDPGHSNRARTVVLACVARGRSSLRRWDCRSPRRGFLWLDLAELGRLLVASLHGRNRDRTGSRGGPRVSRSSGRGGDTRGGWGINGFCSCHRRRLQHIKSLSAS